MPFSQLAPLRRDSSSISDHTLGPSATLQVRRQWSHDRRSANPRRRSRKLVRARGGEHYELGAVRHDAFAIHRRQPCHGRLPYAACRTSLGAVTGARRSGSCKASSAHFTSSRRLPYAACRTSLGACDTVTGARRSGSLRRFAARLRPTGREACLVPQVRSAGRRANGAQRVTHGYDLLN